MKESRKALKTVVSVAQQAAGLYLSFRKRIKLAPWFTCSSIYAKWWYASTAYSLRQLIHRELSHKQMKYWISFMCIDITFIDIDLLVCNIVSIVFSDIYLSCTSFDLRSLQSNTVFVWLLSLTPMNRTSCGYVYNKHITRPGKGGVTLWEVIHQAQVR